MKLSTDNIDIYNAVYDNLMEHLKYVDTFPSKDVFCQMISSSIIVAVEAYFHGAKDWTKEPDGFIGK